MNIHDELRRLWAELQQVPPGQRQWRALRIAANCPLRIFAALRSTDSAPAVILESAVSNAPSGRARLEAEGLSVREEREFEVDTYRVVLALERRELHSVFESLSADLLGVCIGQDLSEGAWAALIARLGAWQACLRARNRGLGREAITGLVGELVCLQLLANGRGYGEAVSAWQGPVDGLHDFKFPSVSFEVKSVVGSDRHISISCLDQLDTTGPQELVVLRPRFSGGPQGGTLSDWVRQIRSEIGITDPGVLVEFEGMLLRAGYLDADGTLYLDRYHLQQVTAYPVTGGFPRVTRDNIDQRIVEARYILDERTLAPFAVSGEGLEALLGTLIGG